MNVKAGVAWAAVAVLATVFCAGADTTNTAGQIKTGVYAGRGISGNGATEWFRIVERSPELELKIVDSEMRAYEAIGPRKWLTSKARKQLVKLRGKDEISNLSSLTHSTMDFASESILSKSV